MNILVLGGTGFIGSHFVDAALGEGFSVKVLSRSAEKFRKPLQGVEYRIGDFKDEKLLAGALEGVDVVFHALSASVPATSNKNPQADIENNLLGTVKLLDQMVKCGVKRIIYLSSGGAVYGNSAKTPVAETEPTNPLSSYAITKVAIEDYLLLYEKLHGLRPLIFRPSNVYGPRHGHIGVQGLITTSLSEALHGRALKVWGDGTAIRDYLYIDDFIKLCILGLKSDEVGIFNAGAGCGHSVLEIIDAISQILGKKVDAIFGKSNPTDVKKIVLDISKARRTFGWKPVTALSDGIKLTSEWMARNLES
ncbi:MAG: NAD-dependent epimerase/dehydratase family protein [Patescibacteria group bacterium]